MDLDDVAAAVCQELWNKVAFETKKLVSETKDVTIEKESFREFSEQISRLNAIFEVLQAKNMETASLESTKASLETLHSQLIKGRNIIKEYKSGSKLWFMINSHSILGKMQELGKEIAKTVSLMELANLESSLYVKSEMEKMIGKLEEMEFDSSRNSDIVVSEIEKSMESHGRSREKSLTLLNKIAEACGTSVGSLQSEISLLKQEKEDMEAQKKQAEAYQLSQLITLLNSSEISPPEDGNIFRQNSIDSFTCPLSNEVMTDPVAIVCGHSFERKAIQVHFGQGEITCPVCKEQLFSLDLTPNISLKGSIEEWNREMKFQNAVSEINSSENEVVSKSLEELQTLMEIPRYRTIVSERRLIPKMVGFLQHDRENAHAALKCLFHLSCHSDENKEIMIKERVIRYIIKCFYKGEAHTDAIAIFLEMSRKETFAEIIGNTKDCIPLLVSMLDNSNHDVSDKAEMVLENLSLNIQFAIKMAESGYFLPFISRFNEGTFESRAFMAVALVNTQIDDKKITSFQEKQFICKIVELLCSGSPAFIMASLKCIKKLLLYPNMVEWFLEESITIPHLLEIISYNNAETHWKLEAVEVLTSLVEKADLENNLDLQSQLDVSLFMNLATNSEQQLKVKVLKLLIVLAEKSEKARDMIRSNTDAVKNLFASMNTDQPEVRQQVMKLIYTISKKHPMGVPLPPAPGKEDSINTLVAILKSSPDKKERTFAAGILSCLPPNDLEMDEILGRSEALRAIEEVLYSSIDNVPDESLLENVLAALLHYTQPTKPELQKQVRELELYPSLVSILSTGSGSLLAKEYAAGALAHLSQSTDLSINDAANVERNGIFHNVFSCFSSSATKKEMCSVHGHSCSSRDNFCLVKVDAVRPLIQTLSYAESGAAEASLMALNTMMIKDSNTISKAVSVIVENHGVVAILEVMEKGTLSAKEEALDLLQKIIAHTEIPRTESQRAERILIHFLTDGVLKKKTALVLRQMKIIPEQSSYF
ncbi:hypothetical protein ACHQM5_025977 [Ranunculus cassubicifolius]